MSARKTKKDLEFELERLRKAARDVVSSYLSAEEKLRDKSRASDERYPIAFGMLAANVPHLGRVLAESSADDQFSRALEAEETRRQQEFEALISAHQGVA